ncbi:inositol monophosphatase 1-like [Teleopsis dalmanni]|uniref:inositol monophosphatase 1-like n=1 Tax=Teleopsis dalmanni TaxID=139649 RepID=UPI000D32D30D|nr:inositol monophosphatase 1-like [Teleopsis dalmanni]XP_037940652.1 inositol monophosphatase 1-like [Teleopsis dalmanni]XP_037940653.1 inositol monophosphatase 1-like [Teleopsis dalmanni]
MVDTDVHDLDKCFEVVVKHVKAAGDVIRRRSELRQEYELKADDIDLVTQTDKQVEQMLMIGLAHAFPDHKFIAEEESSAGGSPKKLTNDPTWIIDPVDGTMNFVHSFPHSCISIGLVINKVTEIGVVYNPILEQFFTARRGQGALYNGRRIKVSGQRDLTKSLVTSEFGTTRDVEKMLVVNQNFAKLAAKVHGLRCLGSAALNMCMVALGAADANYEFGIHAWDVCAGDIIVREAGGVVIDPAGRKFDMMSRRVLAAATPELATEITKLITQYYPEPRDD